jgi:hypothetical protein
MWLRSRPVLARSDLVRMGTIADQSQVSIRPSRDEHGFGLPMGNRGKVCPARRSARRLRVTARPTAPVAATSTPSIPPDPSYSGGLGGRNGHAGRTDDRVMHGRGRTLDQLVGSSSLPRLTSIPEHDRGIRPPRGRDPDNEAPEGVHRRGTMHSPRRPRLVQRDRHAGVRVTASVARRLHLISRQRPAIDKRD